MKFTIFHKLFLTMLILAFLPLIGLWYLDYTQEQHNLETQLEQNIIQTARATAAKVNAWADINLRALRNNAALVDVVSMETERQAPILKTMAKTYEWTYLIFATDPQGYMTARNDDEKEPIYKPDGSKAHFRGDRPYFQQPMQGRPFGQQVLISRTNNQPAHCLSVPIQGANLATVGVLTE
jgi:methyl-accepting chemotaxis protein